MIKKEIEMSKWYFSAREFMSSKLIKDSFLLINYVLHNFFRGFDTSSLCYMSTLCSDLSEVPRTFTLCHLMLRYLNCHYFYFINNIFGKGNERKFEYHCWVLEWKCVHGWLLSNLLEGYVLNYWISHLLTAERKLTFET